LLSCSINQQIVLKLTFPQRSAFGLCTVAVPATYCSF